jgi:hypothetical protein
MPRVISAKTHGIIDYIHGGANLLFGILLRNRDRRASKAAFAMGGAILGNALMTDYPLGVFRLYSFKTHGYLDYGVSAAAGSMPTILRSHDRLATGFFRLQSSAEGIVAGLTDYKDVSGSRKRVRGWSRAA